MNSGLYAIRNKETGVTYFGRTIDWLSRSRRHKSDLRAGRHKNPRLQNSWNAHGEECFEFSLVWPESIENLEELESFVLDFTFSSGRVYNAHKNSVGGFLGQKHSEDTKRKWSAARSGRKLSDATKARQSASRVESAAWKAHQAWMKTPDAIADRCAKAALPSARAKAVATRKANGHKPFSDESRQIRIEAARQNLFAALDWAVANGATRDQVISKFGSSWGSLKKFQAEWEQLNGPLSIPKRASGEKSGMFKHGLSAEMRRKKTPAELEAVNRKRSEHMSGANNPMFGRRHTEQARQIQSEAAKRQAQARKD